MTLLQIHCTIILFGIKTGIGILKHNFVVSLLEINQQILNGQIPKRFKILEVPIVYVLIKVIPFYLTVLEMPCIFMT